MYLYLTQTLGLPGREADYEDLMKRQTDLSKGQTGFQGDRFLNSLSAPSKYAVVSQWHSRDDWHAHSRSEGLHAFQAENLASAVSTPAHPAEGYELLLTTSSGGQGGGSALYLTLDWWTINLGMEADFEASANQVFELRSKQQEGFVTNRLWRLMGVPNRYLVVHAYRSREALHAFGVSEQNRDFLQKHPPADFLGAPYVTDTYEVLHRVSGAGGA